MAPQELPRINGRQLQIYWSRGYGRVVQQVPLDTIMTSYGLAQFLQVLLFNLLGKILQMRGFGGGVLTIFIETLFFT